MTTNLINLANELVYILITTLFNILTVLDKHIDKSSSQEQYLRNRQSFLVATRNLITQQLTAITASPYLNTNDPCPQPTDPTPHPAQTLIPGTPVTVKSPSSVTRRRRFRPYPLPYTPPRTPEEVRKNNIVNWINEIRAQQQPDMH